MNLLLNASNLRHGGGKTVALQLIDGIARFRPQDRFYVIIPLQAEFQELRQYSNIVLLELPEFFHHSWHHKIAYNHNVFSEWCRQYKIDKIISLGNVAFPANGIPQLVYIQLPHLVYPEVSLRKTGGFQAYWRNRMMVKYVSWHLRYATAVALQTEVMEVRFLTRFPDFRGPVFILPNAAYNLPGQEIKPIQLPLRSLRLLFLSRYYPHKGFEILPKIGRLLRQKNIPVQIHLTLDTKEALGAARVLRQLKHSYNISNRGPIALKDLGRIMEEYDGVFLPSFMESHSGAYAEALQHRRLIFTSHFDFATALLGSAGIYFDPLKPDTIVSAFENVVNNENYVKEKLRSIEAAAKKAPEIEDVIRRFSEIIDAF